MPNTQCCGLPRHTHTHSVPDNVSEAHPQVLPHNSVHTHFLIVDSVIREHYAHLYSRVRGNPLLTNEWLEEFRRILANRIPTTSTAYSRVGYNYI